MSRGAAPPHDLFCSAGGRKWPISEMAVARVGGRLLGSPAATVAPGPQGQPMARRGQLQKGRSRSDTQNPQDCGREPQEPTALLVSAGAPGGSTGVAPTSSASPAATPARPCQPVLGSPDAPTFGRRRLTRNVPHRGRRRTAASAVRAFGAIGAGDWWRDDQRPMASSPLIVIPTTNSVPPCSGLSRRGISVVAQELGTDEGIRISTNQCAALDCGDDRRWSAWREPCNHFDRPRPDWDPAVVGIADFGTSPGGHHHRVAWCQFRGSRDFVEARTVIDLHRPLDGNQRSRAS
jgi:hypothetical protein